MNKEQFKQNATTIGGAGNDGDVWAPGFDDSKMPRFKATEGDHRIGFYIGHKTGVGKNSSEVHVFQTPEGHKFQIWGTKVLDDKMGEVRQKFGMGRLCLVEWGGRVINKASKEEYDKTPEAHRAIKFPWNTSFWQAWSVSVDEKTPALTIKGEDQVFKQVPSNNAPPAPVVNNLDPLPADLPQGFGDETDGLPY